MKCDIICDNISYITERQQLQIDNIAAYLETLLILCKLFLVFSKFKILYYECLP